MAAGTCAHGGCTCTVDSGQQYCSDYCSSHGGGSGHEHSCEERLETSRVNFTDYIGEWEAAFAAMSPAGA